MPGSLKRPLGLLIRPLGMRSLYSRKRPKTEVGGGEDAVLQEEAARREPEPGPSVLPNEIDEEDPHPTPVPEPEALPEKRTRKLTSKLREMLGLPQDALPEGSGPLFAYIDAPEPPPPAEPEPLFVPPPPPPRRDLRALFKTFPNRFRTTRTYKGRPTGVPDRDTHFERFLSDTIHLARDWRKKANPKPHPPREVNAIIHPYPNLSTLLFSSNWSTSSGKKTKRDRNVLMNDVLFHKDFRLEDVRGANLDALDKEAVEYYNKEVQDECHQRGWKKSTVYINIPTGVKVTKASKKRAADDRRRQKLDAQDHPSSDEEDGPKDVDPSSRARVHRFPVPGFCHRGLVSVIKEACSASDSKDFHWHPYEEHWSPPWDGAAMERIHGELYSSSAFLEADQELQTSLPEPDCHLPRCVAALMMYSDATQVAQFGQASVWPVYAYFGNQSKYERGRSSTRMAHNVAFLPSLPDGVTDFIYGATDKHASASLLTHCKRELYHACFGALYDGDFLHAYRHGIVVDCSDGIRRRMYPRIFIHSADYKEKVLIVTIKDFGTCACPRCKVPTEDFWKAGMASDMKARMDLVRLDDEERRQKVNSALQLVYEKGYVVDSKRVDKFLKAESLIPTKNTYSNQVFLDCGMNVFSLAAIDLMHEVELGVWKMLLQHLVRVLYCQGTGVVQVFNARFRKVTPFGVDTIRRFKTNVSDLKKLAARDYEDILQCIIPCIEGLLPQPFNDTILDLLYTMAYFHSLAKLRMHTDSSLHTLRLVITSLCDALRYFAFETCKHFKTVETDKEYQARQRQTATYNLKNGKTLAVNGKRAKRFSLVTAKFHVLPDYPEHIVRFGTTDCYTTRRGETRHRLIKGYYQRTNKNNPIPQIVQLDNLSAIHTHMKNELKAREHLLQEGQQRLQPFKELDEEMAQNEGIDFLKQRYSMARSTKNAVILPLWLQQRCRDPAIKDFIPRLKAYLLAQHRTTLPATDVFGSDEAQLASIRIKNHTIYAHATASFHYTTYDLRREQDRINTNKNVEGEPLRCDIMLPSIEAGNPHPYSYARVLGIYHADVYFKDSTVPKMIEFLWVRRFQQEPAHPSGPSHLRLARVGFVSEKDPTAFDFLHPSAVIRACHLIPVFEWGRTVDLLGPSLARHPQGDWTNYYVNRFVDRDMMMRYLGLGVGHCHPANFPREDGELLMLPTTGPNYPVTEEDCAVPEAAQPPDEVEEWFAEQVDGIQVDGIQVDYDSEDEEAFSEDEFIA
ncbi:hypothetical protein BDN72DRAFT_904115 [Pluteus cervinus]|uniref:Uncharacterized protein n=1 Tax=Pluteus cervinus TaxID=181527 RepID=A0ACD3A6V4_9AGAR|nr:hypothetical protein BDN72DRAFT_904115 [Pluteus cervinus]